ncbi:MAG: hypothetical protein M1476_02280 [Candidatus Thermoplasmatota archaeon]|nr:hypothetical protein [Candidatus Thermoplasmatota archaeon]
MVQTSAVNIESTIKFKSREVRESAEWIIQEMLPKYWNQDKWQICAKGGNKNEKYAKHRDMPYLVHILTGCLCSLRIIDYWLYKGDGLQTLGMTPEEITRRIKRGAFGYFYHDYVKLTETDIKMRDFELFKSHLNAVDDLFMRELGLNQQNVYDIAFSTEQLTSFNSYSKGNPNQESLEFERAFSRMSDKISSSLGDEREELNVEFAGTPILSEKDIGKIHLSSTHLFALTGIARNSIMLALDNSDFFYLWTTRDTIYFIKKDPINLQFKDLIVQSFTKELSKKLKPEKAIEMNDRTVRMSISEFVKIGKENVEKWMRSEEHFKQAFYFENIPINDKNRTQAEELTDIFNNQFKSFNINFYGKNNLRDGIETTLTFEEDREVDDELYRIFVVRYIQLLGNNIEQKNPEKFPGLKQVLIRLKDVSKVSLTKKYPKLLGKLAEKSSLIIPFILKDVTIDWQLLDKEIDAIWSKDARVDYRGVISRIMQFANEPLPDLNDVPSKDEMSIITGEPAQKYAETANLYGVNTQTFTNRIVTSSRVSKGKIDDLSILENVCRKIIFSGTKDSAAILFATFSGSIPITDSLQFFRSMRKDQGGRVDVKNLEIGNMTIGEQVDNSIMIPIGNIVTMEDAYYVLKKALDFYDATKMQVLVTYSNSPIIGPQKESIKFEISNPLLQGMGWTSIRCNQVSDIKAKLYLFQDVANNCPGKPHQVITDFIMNPFSLFYWIHKSGDKMYRLASKKNELKSLILGRVKTNNVGTGKGLNMDRLEKMAEIAAKMKKLGAKASNNEKTWWIRESLDVIEKTRVSLTDGAKRDLNSFEVYVSGNILATLERDEKVKGLIPTELVKSFSKEFISMLKEDFGSKMPSGSMKSYLIQAFEFLYFVKSEEFSRSGKIE